MFVFKAYLDILGNTLKWGTISLPGAGLLWHLAVTMRLLGNEQRLREVPRKILFQTTRRYLDTGCFEALENRKSGINPLDKKNI